MPRTARVAPGGSLFLLFPSWILLLYLCGASWRFHRQVLREENYLRQHYGEEYVAYCRRVRRYF
jgi:protein-S-isoprenylcysteine O-methyltransferase Ste14